MKCKPSCALGGTLSKTRLASCSGGILAGSAGSILAGYSAGSTGQGSTGELLWDAQRDNRREPRAHSSDGILGGIHWRGKYYGILSGILGGIHWRAALVGYSAGTLTGPADSVANRSGGILGGIHLRAALAGYSAGSAGEPLGGILGGIHRGAALAVAGYSAIHWQAALAGYSAGSTGEPLWRDTRRDQLASRSGGILGGINWRAALAGYLAGSTGERRDGGIHWRAALAGYWVGAWCRSIANADSNIKSNNPFLSGGE